MALQFLKIFFRETSSTKYKKMIPRLRGTVGILRQCAVKEDVCLLRLNIGQIQLRRTSTTAETSTETSTPSLPSSSFPSPNSIPFSNTQPKPIPEKTDSPQSVLAPLLNNSNIYMTVYINNFPYLLSPNDTLHLPFHLSDAPLGSILRMTHVSRIGCRDYTLQGHPFIDKNAFTLKMRVIEHTKQPLVVTIKKKQRQRRARHLPNKQNYTVLKYSNERRS